MGTELGGNTAGIGRTVIGAGFGDVWWWHGAAVVLWWRVLGLLRDPSDVASPQNLAQILKHFSELMETPVKLSNNYQSISPDTQSSPEPPELILPHTHGGSLLLQGPDGAPCLPPGQDHDTPLPRDMPTHLYRAGLPELALKGQFGFFRGTMTFKNLGPEANRILAFFWPFSNVQHTSCCYLKYY
ncbi:uncharacterized protein LOC126996792 isoform X2 [Eriocheir sinensis]|uniref:uncharacterized protein LOC126996792 isoform X2 n=1 Tax=Eriocheir sinensis TaxID=95602 RepID=UPI0021C83D46|nr:uncharacterized protein LOC126996792 isoform X2 [Eriocheir sinensis]XP_050713624.1 uncharacterized protein LOC126996792 isoform X2 [Eriocheir sinensis]XP_050713629.1 uncharacterized protein LOC126996792 isoform X2 [Eriocheir sinensis]XP_050713634.1 uncharacterized protein LOC126996792 isoform X2 [Eriocheir sinensis]XP_050713641.1 uncharacterized protein LOC126996792 isoform X2 [Eriocheir sinensis]XP_050713645.1 uncharacterized protein LOC126996792 isoform X2 [Eriocheir sinensis]